ncbi:MAG: BamA/TamA family outer membrane protein [Gemmatimonadetes bacterium]|nr:BamA/TamA family outer membrane protein [Gemmatimonadota bacterium]MBT7862263.1 BamA/TamA family outer membrane protein [Gemmatimonadota bacterium]
MIRSRLKRRIAWALAAVTLVSATLAGAAGPVRVQSLVIEGNEHFSDRELGRVMTMTPRRMKKRRYQRAALLSDINALITLYEGEGYLDVGVTDRTLTYNADSSRVDILLQLEEGPRTIVRHFGVEGIEVYDDSTVTARMRLATGRPFMQRDLLRDRSRLQALYAEDARIDTRIRYEAVVDSIAAARVHFQIDEGPPIRLAKIRLEGLEKTRPYVILREVPMAPGDLLRHSDLVRTQTAVFSTGLFRSVLVRPAADSSGQDTRDMTIIVRERNTGALDLGAGYGSFEHLRVVASLAQTNFAGRGLRFGANGRLSRLLRTTEGVYTFPFVLGVRVALDGRLYYTWERNPKAGFRTRSRGIETTFSYQARNRWVADVAYNLQRVRFQRDGDLYQPARTTSIAGLGLRRDTRDNPLDSRAGNYIRTRLEVAGGVLGGASHFNRSSVEFMTFHTLLGIVFAMHVEGSGIDASGDVSRVAEYEQFYLGGDRSVRGYARGEIGADQIGEIAFNGQFEMRLPVGRHGLVLFQDAGQVWTDFADMAVGDLWRASGVGLRYNSRFGMIRMDAAVAHALGSVTENLSLYFGVGQAF